jgi:receptor protein-tyrosine kinase
LLGIGLAVVVERFDRRILEPNEFADAYGVPLLGTVPKRLAFADAGAKPVPATDAEAFSLLRARIRYFNLDRNVRTLLLTSALPDEGRTTIALNLALAEAASGNSNVLLLEADLRRPALAKRLALETSVGLGEILAGSATLRSALRRVPVPLATGGNGSIPSFNIITAGALPPNPMELLASQAMANLLSALAERFDPIIIDSPPVSVIPDAMPLMRLVSGAIIIGRLGSITRDSARELGDQLRKLKAPVLGVVANAVTGTAGYSDRHRYPFSAKPQRSDDPGVLTRPGGGTLPPEPHSGASSKTKPPASRSGVRVASGRKPR